MSYSRIPAAALTLAFMATPLSAAEQSYDLSGFTNVSVERGIDVTLTTGTPFQVTAEASRGALLEEMQIFLRGDTLVISRDADGSFSVTGLVGRYHVTVSMPGLEDLETMSGAEVVGVLGEGPRVALRVTASSGSQIALSGLSVDALSVSASSGSQVDLAGSCADVQMDASTGAGIDGDRLSCARADLRASSGANIDLAVTDRLKGRVSGGGDIDITGAPEIESLHESSGGDVSISN